MSATACRDGKRLYKGHFTSWISSTIWSGLTIYLPPPNRDGEVNLESTDALRISLSMNIDGDPRFDKRVYDALDSAGLIRE